MSEGRFLKKIEEQKLKYITAHETTELFLRRRSVRKQETKISPSRRRRQWPSAGGPPTEGRRTARHGSR
jgi:hypothetical protein